MRQAFFARFDSEGTGAASAFLGRLFRTALVGLPLIVGGATTEAQTLASLPSPSAAIEKNGGARPVAAWVDFCRRHPAECAVDTSEPATITMTPEVWRTILSVNRRTNARIKPKTDMEHWGIVDRWDFPEDGYGDCEDYQLLKRKLLAEWGFSRRAMRMTVVIDDLGEGHAVLMIRTDRGDYILDNKTSAVLPWRDTGYTYVKREGQDSTAWVSLGGVGSPVATANR
jgi:predicted transglutaminase-like cysteine proteinase